MSSGKLQNWQYILSLITLEGHSFKNFILYCSCLEYPYLSKTRSNKQIGIHKYSYEHRCSIRSKTIIHLSI